MSDNNNHTFNVEFASRYGIEEALIFGDIYYWCLQNKLNEKNLKKGKDAIERYYTFNSVASLQTTYKYISLTKVYRVIEKLETEGLIITGCFNKRSGDRTRWYAVTEFGEKTFRECCSTFVTTLYDSQFSNCKLQNERCNSQNEMHNLQNEMTLPNTNTNTNENTYNSTSLNSEPPKFTPTSTTKKTSSRTKKTETEKHEEYLSSLFQTEREETAKCVDLFIELHKQLDPCYNRDKSRLAWQVEFAKYHKESTRSFSQIQNVLKYGMNDEFWKTRLSSPKILFNAFETILQQSLRASSNYSKNRETDLERGNMNTGHREYEVF